MVHEVVMTQSCPDGAVQAGLAAGHSLLIVRGGGLATGGGDGGGGDEARIGAGGGSSSCEMDSSNQNQTSPRPFPLAASGVVSIEYWYAGLPLTSSTSASTKLPSISLRVVTRELTIAVTDGSAVMVAPWGT